MEGSVGGDPPPPPDLAGSPPLNPQGTPSAAVGASPAPAGAPKFAAGGVSDLGKGAQQPLAPAARGSPSAPAGASTYAAAGDDGKGAQPTLAPAAPARDLGQHKGKWDGGLGTAQIRNGAPSFAEVLVKTIKPRVIPVLVHPPAATDAGKPAAFFSTGEVRSSCKPLEYTIIAKTPRGRPPYQVIRTHLTQRFNLSGDFVISPYDERHLLLQFENEEDYLKILLKDSMAVQGRMFRFVQWTTDFQPEVDSPIVPVWMAMPRLPANYYFEPMLRSIAGSVGPVLQISESTMNMTKTHAAIVCVQLDVSKELHDHVWIGVGSGGFWQPIVYINRPQFCTGCSKLGHSVSKCRQGLAAGSSKRDPNDAQQVFEGNPHRTGKVQDAKRPPPTADPPPTWRPVKNKEAPAAHDQVRGIYLTPPKQRRSPQVPQHLNPHTTQHQEGNQLQEGAIQVPHVADQLVSTLKRPDISPKGDPQAVQQPSSNQSDAPQVFDQMIQSLDQLSLKDKAPVPSVGRSRGLSPAAPAWSPSVHERGDIDLPDDYPSLPYAARNEQTQISARGKEPELLTAQLPEADFISRPTTYDVMNFPGIPELPDDVPPKLHTRGRLPLSVSQGGGAAQLVDKAPPTETPQIPEAGQKESPPHTPAQAPVSSPHLTTAAGPSRISFTAALHKRVRASDTRRTQRALEESDPEDGLTTSDSSEEDELPPPPPPLISDWVQAAAPGRLIIGLPAPQQEAEMPKMPAKEGGEPKLPTRQTRQTLRRGFL